jgi:hypothetical protein
MRVTWNPAIQFIHASWGNTRPGKDTAHNNLKVSDGSGSIGMQDTEICCLTDNKLTLSSFAYNGSGISNICNKQAITYNNGCRGS